MSAAIGKLMFDETAVRALALSGAILLLLARLGLRSSEVVFLELDDIDWKDGSLKSTAKGAGWSNCPCPKMSARQSPRTYNTDDHAAPVVACFCVLKLPSVAF